MSSDSSIDLMPLEPTFDSQYNDLPQEKTLLPNSTNLHSSKILSQVNDNLSLSKNLASFKSQNDEQRSDNSLFEESGYNLNETNFNEEIRQRLTSRKDDPYGLHVERNFEMQDSDVDQNEDLTLQMVNASSLLDFKSGKDFQVKIDKNSNQSSFSPNDKTLIIDDTINPINFTKDLQNLQTNSNNINSTVMNKTTSKQKLSNPTPIQEISNTTNQNTFQDSLKTLPNVSSDQSNISLPTSNKPTTRSFSPLISNSNIKPILRKSHNRSLKTSNSLSFNDDLTKSMEIAVEKYPTCENSVICDTKSDLSIMEAADLIKSKTSTSEEDSLMSRIQNLLQVSKNDSNKNDSLNDSVAKIDQALSKMDAENRLIELKSLAGVIDKQFSNLLQVTDPEHVKFSSNENSDTTKKSTIVSNKNQNLTKLTDSITSANISEKEREIDNILSRIKARNKKQEKAVANISNGKIDKSCSSFDKSTASIQTSISQDSLGKKVNEILDSNIEKLNFDQLQQGAMILNNLLTSARSKQTDTETNVSDKSLSGITPKGCSTHRDGSLAFKIDSSIDSGHNSENLKRQLEAFEKSPMWKYVKGFLPNTNNKFGTGISTERSTSDTSSIQTPKILTNNSKSVKSSTPSNISEKTTSSKKTFLTSTASPTPVKFDKNEYQNRVQMKNYNVTASTINTTNEQETSAVIKKDLFNKENVDPFLTSCDQTLTSDGNSSVDIKKTMAVIKQLQSINVSTPSSTETDKIKRQLLDTCLRIVNQSKISSNSTSTNISSSTLQASTTTTLDASTTTTSLVSSTFMEDKFRIPTLTEFRKLNNQDQRAIMAKLRKNRRIRRSSKNLNNYKNIPKPIDLEKKRLEQMSISNQKIEIKKEISSEVNKGETKVKTIINDITATSDQDTTASEVIHIIHRNKKTREEKSVKTLKSRGNNVQNTFLQDDKAGGDKLNTSQETIVVEKSKEKIVEIPKPVCKPVCWFDNLDGTMLKAESDLLDNKPIRETVNLQERFLLYNRHFISKSRQRLRKLVIMKNERQIEKIWSKQLQNCKVDKDKLNLYSNGPVVQPKKSLSPKLASRRKVWKEYGKCRSPSPPRKTNVKTEKRLQILHRAEKRPIDTMKMLRQSRQKWKNLPENRNKLVNENRQAIYATYRLNAKCFNKRLQQEVLGVRGMCM